MKAIGRHMWRLLFPRRLPTLRRPALVIQPYQPPSPKEKHHVHTQRLDQKTRGAGSSHR
jgi:hypothetical protein